MVFFSSMFQFTLQLSLSCLMEYCLFLTRLNADMMYLHQDSGLMNVSYFKFDVDDSTGLLDDSRPVPFRLTPNIVEFLSTIGVTGPLTASTIATARCLVQPNFKLPTILRAILRDEIIAVQKKRILDEKVIDQNTDLSQENPAVEIDSETVISTVNKAVNNIMARLNCLARFDNTEVKKMSTLVQVASNADNLCRMDPTWHPWL